MTKIKIHEHYPAPSGAGQNQKKQRSMKKTEQAISFDEWYKVTTELVLKKQKHPFASYRKNKWRKKNGVWKQMYNDGDTPEQAAGLWHLNHEIVR